MELILLLLDMAEKQGIITGGSDPDGNFAYVVMDSKSNIVVTVRPTGRTTLNVAGNSTDYNLMDDPGGEQSAAFVGDFVGSLVNDNLDHKATKLTSLIDDLPDEEESDEESEEDEDTTEDDEDEVEVEEEEEPEESEEEASVAPVVLSLDPQPEVAEGGSCIKEERDEDKEDEPLNESELALMREHLPAIIDSMIETAADPALFAASKFLRILGATKPNSSVVQFYAGARLIIRVKRKPEVELMYGRGVGNGGHKVKTKSGKDAVKLLREYKTLLETMDSLNHINGAHHIAALDAVIAGVEANVPVNKLYDLCTALASSGNAKNGATVSGKTFYVYFAETLYTVGVTPSPTNSEEDKVYFITSGRGRSVTILSIKADFMVSVAAALAKAATGMGAPNNLDTPLYNNKRSKFSDVLLALAIKLGYTGESEASVKIQTSGTIRTPAS